MKLFTGVLIESNYVFFKTQCCLEQYL